MAAVELAPRAVRRAAGGWKYSPFSKKQMKVLTWWKPGSPVRDMDAIICDGSVRAGKSLPMAISFIMWAMDTFNGAALGMSGHTIQNFRRNVLTPIILPRMQAMGYKVREKRGENLVIISKGERQPDGTRLLVRNTFYIFGGHDENSAKMVQGMTLAGFLFDEAVNQPESFVTQAVARCSVEGGKLWFNCNPDSPFHWFKLEWIDKAREKRAIVLHFTMEDNRSLSEAVKERYRRMFTGVFYERYILGLWRVAHGLIYDMFSDAGCCVSKDMADRRDGTIKPLASLCDKFYISCDYGTQNATVFILWGRYLGTWYGLRTYYHQGRGAKQKTDAQYADDLATFWERPPKECAAVLLDPSAASFKVELQGRGWWVEPANNDVVNGIRYTGSALAQGAIKFTRHESNRAIFQEFVSYRWDDKAARTGQEKPVKEADHAMDAMRYFVYTVLGNSREIKAGPSLV